MDLELDSESMADANNSYLSVFDVSKDFLDKWSLHAPGDLCSLSYSGPTGAQHSLLFLLHPAVPPFDHTALAGLDEAGICDQVHVVRKLLMFLQIKELMFTALQNHIVMGKGQLDWEFDCQLATNAFFTAIQSLTTKCEEACRAILTKRQSTKGTWKHRRDRDTPEFTRYVIRHYRDRESPSELAAAAASLDLSVSYTRTWIEKRWARLDRFLASDGPMPRWVPKEMSRDDLISVLRTKTSAASIRVE
jgi:hypothetical protein